MNENEQQLAFLLGIISSLNEHQKNEALHVADIIRSVVKESSVGRLGLALTYLEMNLEKQKE